MSTPRRSRGFSLLEVILALGILAGGMVVLGELARQGLRYAELARDMTEAQILCESKLAEFTSGVTTPTGIASSPLETDASSPRKWLCSVDVSSLSNEGLLAIRVTVTKESSDQAKPLAVSLTRWMIDPMASFTDETTEDEYSNMQQTQP